MKAIVVRAADDQAKCFYPAADCGAEVGCYRVSDKITASAGNHGQQTISFDHVAVAKSTGGLRYRLCPMAYHLDFYLARVAEMSWRRQPLQPGTRLFAANPWHRALRHALQFCCVTVSPPAKVLRAMSSVVAMVSLMGLTCPSRNRKLHMPTCELPNLAWLESFGSVASPA